MNWPQEKGNMLVHAFTKNSQPAKWFQISGSPLHQLRFQGEAEIVLDSCFPKCPFFSVAPRGSKHSLPVFSWMLTDDDLTDSSRDQTLMAEQLRECNGNRQKEEGRWQGRSQDSAASKSCAFHLPRGSQGKQVVPG